MGGGVIWRVVTRADSRARELADRHYNRQSPGSAQFVPPGRCLVLYASTDAGRAFWVTSWPFAQYVKHRWAGAWICSAFRNEGAGVASEMIWDALAASRAWFGDPPPLGLVTFIDPEHVRPLKVRGREPVGFGAAVGQTYRRAGFRLLGATAGGLPAFGIDPTDMPRDAPALGMNMGTLL